MNEHKCSKIWLAYDVMPPMWIVGPHRESHILNPRFAWIYPISSLDENARKDRKKERKNERQT